jgi:hypothetical protein
MNSDIRQVCNTHKQGNPHHDLADSPKSISMYDLELPWHGQIFGRIAFQTRYQIPLNREVNPFDLDSRAANSGRAQTNIMTNDASLLVLEFRCEACTTVEYSLSCDKIDRRIPRVGLESSSEENCASWARDDVCDLTFVVDDIYLACRWDPVQFSRSVPSTSKNSRMCGAWTRIVWPRMGYNVVSATPAMERAPVI